MSSPNIPKEYLLLNVSNEISMFSYSTTGFSLNSEDPLKHCPGVFKRECKKVELADYRFFNT